MARMHSSPFYMEFHMSWHKNFITSLAFYQVGKKPSLAPNVIPVPQKRPQDAQPHNKIVW